MSDLKKLLMQLGSEFLKVSRVAVSIYSPIFDEFKNYVINSVILY